MPEHKIVPFELTKVDSEGRTFEGYASTFRSPADDQPDHTGDMVMPGAFKRTLAERGHKIRMLWQHDPGQPIGRFTELREDKAGLFVRGVISDTRLGRDVLSLLKDRAIDSMSIGYDIATNGADWGKGKDGKPVRLLKEVRLWEVSLVTFPADEQAKVLAVKQPALTISIAPPEVEVKALGDALTRLETTLDLALDDALAAACTARLLSGAVSAAEVKVGRRISNASASKIRAALAALQELLGEPDEPDAPEEADACSPDDERRRRPKSENPPAPATVEAEPPTDQAGQAGPDSPPEVKAGPDAVPPTAEERAPSPAGPDAIPPTASQGSDAVDPFAEFDQSLVHIAELLRTGGG